MSIDFNSIRRQYSLVEIAAHYIDVRHKGSSVVAVCPFHDDKDPSLNFYRGQDDIERFRCFGCGEHGDVIDFVSTIEGCDSAEAASRLTNGKLPEIGHYKPKPIPADETSCWEPIMPVPEDAHEYAPAKTFNPKRGRVVNYSFAMQRLDAYKDARGRLLFYVIKLVFDDGVKLCPVISFCEGPGGRRGWVAKRPKPPYPLLGMDLLFKYPKKHVVVVEGEGCQAQLQHEMPEINGEPAMVAVSWLGGTNCVDSADVVPLVGRNITYWPDADEEGKKAMIRLQERIEKSGTG